MRCSLPLSLYHRGRRQLPKDMAEAARWYRKAADLGDHVIDDEVSPVSTRREMVSRRTRTKRCAGGVPPRRRPRRQDPRPSRPRSALVKEFRPRGVRARSHLPSRRTAPASFSCQRRLFHLARSRRAAASQRGFGQSSCCQVVISPDGRQAATGNYDEKAARLWNLRDGRAGKGLRRAFRLCRRGQLFARRQAARLRQL